MRKSISAICVAGLLAGCASQETVGSLRSAQSVCAINPTLYADACASIPALKAEANAEANSNMTGAVVTIALLPLLILAAAIGAGGDDGYHHHEYHHHYHR